MILNFAVSLHNEFRHPKTDREINFSLKTSGVFQEIVPHIPSAGIAYTDKLMFNCDTSYDTYYDTHSLTDKLETLGFNQGDLPKKFIVFKTKDDGWTEIGRMIIAPGLCESCGKLRDYSEISFTSITPSNTGDPSYFDVYLDKELTETIRFEIPEHGKYAELLIPMIEKLGFRQIFPILFQDLNQLGKPFIDFLMTEECPFKSNGRYRVVQSDELAALVTKLLLYRGIRPHY